MAVAKNESGEIYAQYMNPNHPATEKFTSKNLPSIKFDGTVIYYYPDMLDLKNNKHDLMITQALLLTEKQSYIGIDADKNEPPSEWMRTIWR